MKGHAVLMSRASDEWSTPRDLFASLDAEFGFGLDAAATAKNALCSCYRGPDHYSPEFRNGLVFRWAPSTYVNPPYSQCGPFIAKAAEEARAGATVVCLVPARTDTRWYHAHIWDREANRFRPGVEVRFVKGRLKFGDSTNSAPFPSMIVIFRPVEVGTT